MVIGPSPPAGVGGLFHGIQARTSRYSRRGDLLGQRFLNIAAGFHSRFSSFCADIGSRVCVLDGLCRLLLEVGYQVAQCFLLSRRKPHALGHLIQ